MDEHESLSSSLSMEMSQLRKEISSIEMEVQLQKNQNEVSKRKFSPKPRLMNNRNEVWEP